MDRTALGFTRRTFRYGQSTVGVGCSTWTNLFFCVWKKRKRILTRLVLNGEQGGWDVFYPNRFEFRAVSLALE